MNTLETLRMVGLAGLGTLAVASAQAQAQPDPGQFYGGAAIGQSHATIDDERVTAQLLGSGLATTAMTNDQSATAWKLFLGYQFNRNLAVEGGYFDLGKFGFTSTTSPAGTLNGSARFQGLNLDLVGTLPLFGDLSAIGRIGAQAARARDSFSGSGAVLVLEPNPGKTAVNYKFGGGLQYAFTPQLMVRGEAERYRVDDAVGNHGDINLYSLGLVYAFGRTPEPAPVRAVVAAPPPPPVAIVEPPPPPPPPPAPIPRRSVSFQADSLFGFDKATLSPEGRAALDRFAGELAGTQFDMIQVQGHTDRLGPAAYNQKLSQQRADAVKAYLVNPGGVDAARIETSGKGESQPVTTAGQCKGERQTPKLIACLQPDRRVDVEVVGSR